MWVPPAYTMWTCVVILYLGINRRIDLYNILLYFNNIVLYNLQWLCEINNHYVPAKDTSFGHRWVIANQRCCNGSGGIIHTFSRSGFCKKENKRIAISKKNIHNHSMHNNNIGSTITGRPKWYRINGRCILILLYIHNLYQHNTYLVG